MTLIREKSNIFISLFLFALLIRSAFFHFANFSPLDAIALFWGAYSRRYLSALIMTLATVWLSDIFINKILFSEWVFFYNGWYWQYASYGLIALLGTRLERQSKLTQLAPTCFASALLFFIVSNAGVWYSTTIYPATLAGFLACLVAAIPFFKNTLLSDCFFSFVLFHGVIWLRAWVLQQATCRSASVIQD